MSDFSTPTWKQVGDLYEENQNLLYENALKLTQILDLEEILYATRTLSMKDGSPCWCCMCVVSNDETTHDKSCERAREATKHLWSKPHGKT